MASAGIALEDAKKARETYAARKEQQAKQPKQLASAQVLPSRELQNEVVQHEHVNLRFWISLLVALGLHITLGGGFHTSQISQETLGNHENP